MAADRAWTIDALRRYWPRGGEAIGALPIVEGPAAVELPVRMTEVELPDWAADCGVDGQLLVPATAAAGWAQVDWFWVAFWYLSNLAEREHERQAGPVHSYSFRLKDWDGRMWRHAWVNRIALFLRRWAARLDGRDEEALFGTRPSMELLITHDLDAVEKTGAIRIKQGAFHAINAARALLRGRLGESVSRLGKSIRFLVSREDYRHFEAMLPASGPRYRRIVNVFGGGRPGRPWLDRLMDPSYAIGEPSVAASLRELAQHGVEIGLHPSFASWNDAGRIADEKARAERALGVTIGSCRQHWLRFSFADTWRAQISAGLAVDTTLGFNDRPGFRNGAALAYHPQIDADGRRIEVWPLVLMDSQLYDYLSLGQKERVRELDRWLDEIEAVGGQASLLWHPHTLGRDYGWADGYSSMLQRIGSAA